MDFNELGRQLAAHQTIKQANVSSEYGGLVTSELISGLAGLGLGAGAGALAAPNNRGMGASVGALGGMQAGRILNNIMPMFTAASTPTRNTDEQAAVDAKKTKVLKDLLVPGVAQHNLWKRIGYATRSPELVEEKLNQRDQISKNRSELHKESGLWSELAGGYMVPAITGTAGLLGGAVLGGPRAGMVGGIAGAALPGIGGSIGALLTDTRTKEEQAAKDIDRLEVIRNLLVPGYAHYNQLKRIGYGSRNPDLKAKRNEIRATRAAR